MKNLIALILVAVLAFGVYYVQKGGGTSAKNFYSGNVLAKIDGQPIYEQEVRERFYSVPRNIDAKFEDLANNVKEALIKEVVAERRIAKHAIEDGLDKDIEVQKKIEMSKSRILREAKLLKVGNAVLSEEKMKETYDTLVKDLDGKQEVKVSHILLKTEEDAEKIYDRIERSRSKDKAFKRLAKEESIDRASGEREGDLGYLLTGTMVKEFEEAALKQEIGAISKPFKAAAGWHIIKVDEVRPAQALPYDQVKGNVSRGLTQQAVQQYLQSILQDVKIDLAAE